MGTCNLPEYKHKTQRDETQAMRAVCNDTGVLPAIAAWLSRPCRLFTPPSGRWDSKLARSIVEIDGRFINHLPCCFVRTVKVQRAALLSILSFGVRVCCSVSSRPFLAVLFSTFNVLAPEWPKALLHPGRSRSAFWKMLATNAVDVRDLLRLDGRNMHYFPTEMRDCQMYAEAVVHKQMAFCGIRHVSLRLRSCASFMAYVIRIRPSAYMLCSAILRSHDIYLLRLALSGGFGRALFCTHAPLRSSVAAGSAAVWASTGLRGIPQDLRSSKDYLYSLAPECGCLLLNGLKEPLLNDATFRRTLASAHPHLASVMDVSTEMKPVASPPTEALPLSTGKRAQESTQDRCKKRARLQELLHCPICMDTVRGRVQQCRMGHIFCAECVARMPNSIEFVCPLCRIRQSRFVLARSLVSERLASLLGEM